jgi:hypothetical protein
MGERRIEVRCARCGKAFAGQRITRRYCSNRCRQAAYLNRLHPPAPPGPASPLTWADFEAILWRPTPTKVD